jgi:hypothetical protein
VGGQIDHLDGQDITDTAYDFKPGRDVNGITVT